MKICVFGSGSIGGHIAARLVESGSDVTVVARGDHLAAIQNRGLVVHTANRELTARVVATDDPEQLGIQDAVIVTVKAPSLPSVANTIGPLLGPHTAVVFATNGIPWWYFYRHGQALDGRSIPALDPGGALAAAVGPHRVIGGVVYGPATTISPGVIRAMSQDSRLILGEPDGSLSDRTTRLADALRAGGMGSEVSTRIRDDIWAKLIQNLAASSLALLAGTTVQDIYREPSCVEAGRRILQEGSTIAHALGCKPVIDFDEAITLMQGLAHKSSALQDLERGRPVEVDALFVVPLALARMCGVATPTLDLLTALVKLRVRSAGLYADHSLSGGNASQTHVPPAVAAAGDRRS